MIHGMPLKAIVGDQGKTMGRTTASRYKQVGIRAFAGELEKILLELDNKEKYIYGK